MLKKAFISVFFIGGFFLGMYAQCLDKDSLWNNLDFLRGTASSNISNPAKLKVLIAYETQIEMCSYRFDSVHAYLLQCIGMIYYRSGDYLQAAEFVNRSSKLVEENEKRATINLRFNINNYFYLSVINDSLNNFSEMLKAIDKCISLGMKFRANDNPSYLRCLYRKVEYYYDVGDFYNCKSSAEDCEKLSWDYAWTDSTSRYKLGEEFASSSLGWRVLSLIKVNRFNEVEEILKNKAQEFKNKIGYLGFIYGRMAEVELHKGNYAKALGYYRSQLNSDKMVGSKEFYCKQTMNNIGYDIYFTGLNNPDKAIACYRNAVLFLNKNNELRRKDSIESLSIYTNMGEAFARKNLFDSAFWYFQLAFDQVKKGSNELDLLRNPLQEFQRIKKIHYLVGLLIAKGDASRLQYLANQDPVSIRNAITTYHNADRFLNRIKTFHLDLQSKLFWRTYARRLYENAISACYLSNDLTGAFYFSERSRAVLLTDQLNMQNWLEEKEIVQLAQLTKDIQRLQKEIDTTITSSKKYSDLQSRKYGLSDALKQFQESVKLKNPLYYQSFLDTTIISVSDVQKKILKGQDVFCELYTGDKAVYIFVISTEQIKLLRVDKAAFEEGTKNYSGFLKDSEKLNSQFDTFVNCSYRLYQLMLGDVKLPRGRIIVSPDGKYFPFEALVTKIINKNPTYFIEDHPVSYTYSARYLLNSFSTASSGDNNFMGVAPVSYSYNPDLAALNGSDQSLKQISAFFNKPAIIIGEKASRNNFMKMYADYNIVQLYTHASDSSNMREPVIWFSDSALYLSELINEKKPLTRLIILSACQTGSGQLNQGEGVFSFNRGFAALGIPSAVANLWKVDSKATYEFTLLFHKYISEGEPTDIALQKAKLAFIASDDYSLPYYWSAPILTGKAEIIELNRTFNWQWILLGIGIVLAGGLVWWRFNKSVK